MAWKRQSVWGGEGNRGKSAINLHELEEGERMFWENYYGWSK